MQSHLLRFSANTWTYIKFLFLLGLSQYTFTSQGDSHCHFPSLCVCPCFLDLSPCPAGSARYFCLTLFFPLMLVQCSTPAYLFLPLDTFSDDSLHLYDLFSYSSSPLKLDGELFISWTMSFYLSHKAYMAFMGIM